MNISEQLRQAAAALDAREQLQQAAAALAARDADHAQIENGVGFNQSDTWYGHSIAALPAAEWSDAVTAHAYRVLRKYSGQLAAYGIDFDAIPVPAAPQNETTKQQARSEVWNKMGERRQKQAREEQPVAIKRVRGGDNFEVSFPYDPALVDDLKVSVPGRRWDGQSKRWIVPFSSRAALAAWGRRNGAEMEQDVTVGLDETEIAAQDELPRKRIEDAGSGRVRICFPYDADTVAAVKRIPSARFDRETKTWSASVSDAAAVRDFAREHGFTAAAAVHELLSTGEQQRAATTAASQALDADLDVALGVELHSFQRAGAAYAINAQRCFIGDEMGLGKTLQALATVAATDSFPAVIVCPNLAGMGPKKWAAETLRALPGRRVSFLNGTSGATVSVRLLDGSRADVPVNDYTADVFVVNYDKLPRWIETSKDDDGRPVKIRNKTQLQPVAGSPLAEVIALQPKALIFDESHYVKNHKAKRTAAIAMIAKTATVRLGLSGTPIVNRPSELIAQLSILDRLGDLGGFGAFTRRYCGATQTRFGLDLSGATNLVELNERLRATCYVRRLKRDVLTELPAKQRETIEFEIDNRRDYDKAAADVVAWIGEQAASDAEFLDEISDLDADEQQKATAAHRGSAEAAARRAEILVRINELRQVAARGKVAAIAEWADNFLQGGDKLVLFAWHREIQDALAEALADWKPARVVGGAGNANVEAVNRFQTDDDCRVIVASLAAGREGIELTASSTVAFAELAWRPGDHDQAEDRCYGRLNDPHGLNAYYLLGEDTIDVDMAELIDAKRAVVDAATDGKQGTTGSGILAALVSKLAARAAS